MILVNSTHFHNVEPARKSASRVVHGLLLYFEPELFRGAGSAREDLEYLEPFLRQDEGFPHVVPAETGTPFRIYDLMRSIAGEIPAQTARSRLAAKTYLRMILVHLVNHYSAYQGASSTLNANTGRLSGSIRCSGFWTSATRTRSPSKTRHGLSG